MIEKRSKLRLKEDERLNEILDIVEPIVINAGVKALKINDIINRCSISRATFYMLIPSKETLIAYLAIRGFNKLFALAERGKNVEGKARLKFLGIYIAHLFFIKLHPALYECIYEANGYSSKSVIDQSLAHLLDQKMCQAITYVQWCIELAIFDQEIKLPERLTPFDLAFYIWSGQYGVTSTAVSAQVNVIDAAKKYKYYVRQSLDALPWYPLSTEVDFDQLSEKIVADIFMEEYKLMGGMNLKF